MSSWDVGLFHWMNGVAISPRLDAVMLLATDRRLWQAIIVLTAVFLALRRDRTARLAAVALILSLALSDTFASQVLKPLIGRARPCHAIDGVRLLVHCGGRNGFPSNHACNAGAVAASLGVFFPWSLAVTLPLALLVAWSRVYVGVHYPADVMAGLGIGAVTGWGVAVVMRRRFSGRRREAPAVAADAPAETAATR